MTLDKQEVGLQGMVDAVDGWLNKVRNAFEIWREREHLGTATSVGPAWQDVLQWHAALELSFAQLAERMEDLTDIADAQEAREESEPVTTQNGIRLLRTARQRLRGLSPELQDHLWQVHLPRLIQQPPPPEVERVDGVDGLFRMRMHDVRVLYEMDHHGGTIVAVVPVHWRPPRGPQA
jgi:hypothetical protein